MHAMERLYHEEFGTNESLADLIKDMDRLYQDKCKERKTGEASPLIKSFYKPPNTYKASRRTCQLALPKCKLPASSDIKSLTYSKRIGRNFQTKLSLKEKKPPKASSLKLIESERVNIKDNINNRRTTPGPKLIVFPPLPEKIKLPCPKRIAKLAEPKHNLMEERKKELEEQGKVYSISEATLKAVPSDRIISLAKHRRRECLEVGKQRNEEIKERKKKEFINRKVESGNQQYNNNDHSKEPTDAHVSSNKCCVEFPPINKGTPNSSDIIERPCFKLLHSQEEDALIALSCSLSDEDLK